MEDNKEVIDQELVTYEDDEMVVVEDTEEDEGSLLSFVAVSAVSGLVLGKVVTKAVDVGVGIHRLGGVRNYIHHHREAKKRANEAIDEYFESVVEEQNKDED